MIEILVVLAVLAILAAIVVRNVASTTESGRSAGLAESLDALRESIYAYRSDVRRYPRQLTQLATQPGTTDLCGRTVPTAFQQRWRGPYTGQTITTNGIPIGDARILNDLVIPTGQAIETAATLYIEVVDVDSTIAARLERAYDGETLSYSDGVILWDDAGNTTTGDRIGTLSFGMPINGC